MARISRVVRLHAFAFIVAEIDVEMGHVFVQRIDEERSCDESNCGRHPGRRRVETFRHLYRGVEETPETGGHHHATGETQHDVQHLSIDGLEKEYQ
jgi:hypothetical protein